MIFDLMSGAWWRDSKFEPRSCDAMFCSSRCDIVVPGCLDCLLYSSCA